MPRRKGSSRTRRANARRTTSQEGWGSAVALFGERPPRPEPQSMTEVRVEFHERLDELEQLAMLTADLAAAHSMICTTAAVTSGPMPSPGRRVILCLAIDYSLFNSCARLRAASRSNRSGKA